MKTKDVFRQSISPNPAKHRGGTWSDAPTNPVAFLLYARCFFTIVMTLNGMLTKINIKKKQETFLCPIMEPG